MLKSGTLHGPFPVLSKFIAQNKTMRKIQAEAANDRHFETFT